MFGALTSDNKEGLGQEESRSFLSNTTKAYVEETDSSRKWGGDALPWKIATGVLSLLLIALSVVVGLSKNTPSHVASYETGFATDLQPAVSAIRIQKQRFYGGISVNESNQFQLNLEPGSPRYTGRPTRELDAAWDRLVGGYLALTNSEAQALQGSISAERGKFYVVPHVRHSLHCVNYLRKVAYEKYYPTIRTENKPTVPTPFMHVDHCIETLRETIQCHGDLTPVPHIWSEEKQMYLADTTLDHTCRDYEAIMEWQDERAAMWEAGEIHN